VAEFTRTLADALRNICYVAAAVAFAISLGKTSVLALGVAVAALLVGAVADILENY
jgi:hypothetical protein